METQFLKKYQPRRYSEFIIDSVYTELLTTLIEMDNLNILLIGNTGSGKTSLLEATIREYYDMDSIPRDNILRINNLHEQGISYYRNEVKTFCQTKSSIQRKKKFVLLDDIDVINEQSQQVFRNCIDKYSHNVNFLASCTNTQKVIESIQSRCTLIKMKPVSPSLLVNILRKIKSTESIRITRRAENFILKICNNSVCLLVNYLEKFKLLDQKITLQKAKEICTNISFYDFETYTKAWAIENNMKEAIRVIFSIAQKGYSVMDILDNYFQFVKVTSILSESRKYKVIILICKYISHFHILHEDDIELALFTSELIKIK